MTGRHRMPAEEPSSAIPEVMRWMAGAIAAESPRLFLEFGSSVSRRMSGVFGPKTREDRVGAGNMLMHTIALFCALIGFIGSVDAAEVKLEQVTIYPGEFSPDPLIVKKGEPLTILVTTQVREHVNRISILPWVTQSDRLSPGKTTIVEFTPDQTGDFEIRNIGHGFTGILRVIE